jgi:type II secretory pathway pseudopilin PulG
MRPETVGAIDIRSKRGFAAPVWRCGSLWQHKTPPACRSLRPSLGTGCRILQYSARAFTFAELLAALVFVAILIPVAVRGVLIANRAGLVAEHKRVAAQLADRMLNELVVTEEWKSSNRQGDFGSDYPGYRWTRSDSAWSQGTIRQITVEVFFEVQGNEYSVLVSTLVDDSQESSTSP